MSTDVFTALIFSVKNHCICRHVPMCYCWIISYKESHSATLIECLPRARHCCSYFAYSRSIYFLQQPWEIVAISPVSQSRKMEDRQERDLLLVELSFGHTSFNTNLLLLILKININTVDLYDMEPHSA